MRMYTAFVNQAPTHLWTDPKEAEQYAGASYRKGEVCRLVLAEHGDVVLLTGLFCFFAGMITTFVLVKLATM